MLFLAAATDQENTAGIDSATVAIIVAVIALLGVLVGQIINLVNESKKRRDGQTAAVRDKVHDLMMALHSYSDFVQETRVTGNPAGHCDPFDLQWRRVYPPLPALAAQMAGRGKHRMAVLELMDSIRLEPNLYHEGLNMNRDPRSDYRELSDAAFETVAAWLRGERVPRAAKRTLRRARKALESLDAEYAWRHRREDGEKEGVIRFAVRRSLIWVRSFWKERVARPARATWGFFFAP